MTTKQSFHEEDTVILTNSKVEETEKAEKQNPTKIQKTSNSRFIRDTGMMATGAAIGVGGTAFGTTVHTNENEVEVTTDTTNTNATTITDVNMDTEMDSQQGTTTGSTLDLATSPNPEEIVLTTAGGTHIAHVDDNMTFGQAFAEARNQVGPGGVFEYKGQLYGTYYKEEWDTLSTDDRREYYAAVGLKNETINDTATTAETPQEYIAQVDAEAPTEEENEVYVLGVGTTTIDGKEMGVAAISYGGQEVLFVDVNQDGTFDVAMSDLNGDGQISENEIADISNQGYLMADAQETFQMQENMHLAQNDLPDYTNDADISYFA